MEWAGFFILELGQHEGLDYRRLFRLDLGRHEGMDYTVASFLGCS
jgi:hypothetical protein